MALASAIAACPGIVDAAPKRATKAANKPAHQAAKPAAKPSSEARWIERPATAAATPAYRYTQLDDTSCRRELAHRKIAIHDEPATLGVRLPVRLAGKLHGVDYRTNLPAAQRATTPWEVVDCRLVLALDDFAAILEAHDIVEVRHYSVYRLPPKSWPADKVASRHNGALAIDAARFIKRDGSYLDVDKHFNGAIDAKTCGDGASPNPVTPEATELRTILCAAVDQHLFHVVLTPNYNQPHKNHFHLELTEGWKAFLVH